jgi:hypothetical protein
MFFSKSGATKTQNVLHPLLLGLYKRKMPVMTQAFDNYYDNEVGKTDFPSKAYQ